MLIDNNIICTTVILLKLIDRGSREANDKAENVYAKALKSFTLKNKISVEEFEKATLTVSNLIFDKYQEKIKKEKISKPKRLSTKIKMNTQYIQQDIPYSEFIQ